MCDGQTVLNSLAFCLLYSPLRNVKKFIINWCYRQESWLGMYAEVLVVTWGFLFMFHNERIARENVS